MNPVLITLVVLSIVLCCINYALRKKRGSAFKKAAKAQNINYTAKSELPKNYKHLGFTALRGTGLFSKPQNVISKKYENHEITIFDYGNESPHSFFLITINNKLLPEFNLYPNKLGKSFEMPLFKYKKIELNHKEFTSKYLLYGQNENELSNLFTNKIRNFLIEAEGLSLEARENFLLFFREGYSVHEDNLKQALGDVEKVFKVFCQPTQQENV